MAFLIKFLMEFQNNKFNFKEILIIIYLYEIFISYFHKTTLYLAIEVGNVEIVRLILSVPNIDVNEKSIFFSLFLIVFLKLFFFNGRTPLHLAVEKQHLDIIKLLLQHKGIDKKATDTIQF